MRLTRTSALVGLAVVAALAAPASASNADKVTGGGQILVASDGRGPGDTITFTAQARPDGTATGMVNVIDRVQGTTGKGYHFRGDVLCVTVEGNVAKVAGHGTAADGTTTGYTLVVTDNGEGALADNDTIALQYVSDPSCDRQNGDQDGETDLARGNAQVRDGDA
jgi:hypothetical protein